MEEAQDISSNNRGSIMSDVANVVSCSLGIPEHGACPYSSAGEGNAWLAADDSDS